ncbi:MAG: ATP-binding protein [candidate division Zixibacteria bacterium]|nr:ATP-binding protein [candidate division Zixibacteria bacterium]
MSCYQWEFFSVTASGEAMLERLQAILEDNLVSPSDRRKFMLAVSEAFNNALIHGNELNPKKTIRVQLCINEDALSADIIDQGQEGLKKIQSPRETDLLSEGGRGVRLMMYCADNVKFEQIENGGLKVTVQLVRKSIAKIT